MSSSFRLKSAFCHVKEPQAVILSVVHGKQEGYTHGLKPCHPRGCPGEQQDHAGNLLGFFICLYLLRDWPDLAGLIYVHTSGS